ncbi:hypothetical protein Bca52824_039868 [Brassica carinata]|uniref:Uncharacterized protein n=1 Tax=Brassica carinata TaxID=52824 RepID=A0A8X7RWS2_BRACI|nr:hypothetical protein Bca52824_039868 [Brassica carinata]
MMKKGFTSFREIFDKKSESFVSVHRLNTFRELLREGAIYELSGIDVTRSNNHFKLCDFVVSIRLNEFTKMFEVPAVANLIPTEMFRFHSLLRKYLQDYSGFFSLST